MERVLVIAEIGSTHDCSFEKALMLIEAAAEAGADVAKFQYWSDADRLAARRGASECKEMYRKYAMPRGWLDQLRKHCDRFKMELCVTTYLPEDIWLVAPLVSRFKIASFEADDDAFVEAHEGYGKQIIVSTGMSDGYPKWAESKRFDVDFRFLHCVSGYPTPIEQLNLRCITDYGYEGLSDHTKSTFTGALAVAAGAKIVEKHLRIPETDHGNPDYPHSLDRSSFIEYVDRIRTAELAMGDGQKRVMPAEQKCIKYKVKPK